MNDYLSRVAGRAGQNSPLLRPLSPTYFGPSIVTPSHGAISEEVGEPMSGMRETKALSGEEQPKVVPTTGTVQQISKPRIAARPDLLPQAEPRSPVETTVTKIEPAPLIPAGPKIDAGIAPDQPVRHNPTSMLQPGQRRPSQNQVDPSLGLEEQDKVLPTRPVASPIGETASATAVPVAQSAVAPFNQQVSFDRKEPKNGYSNGHRTPYQSDLEPQNSGPTGPPRVSSEIAFPVALSGSCRQPQQESVTIEGSLSHRTESSGLLRSQTDGRVGVQSTSPSTAAPEINVTIGRIEIRAVNAPVPKEPPLGKPRLSLDDYLRSRNRGAT